MSSAEQLDPAASAHASRAAERFAVVVNPAAGAGRALRAVPEVLEGLGSAGVRARVDVAGSLEHAEELTAAAADRGEVVVAMGGDGLTGRLAGVVAERGGLLGLVPAGRGNDFARAVGIPRDPYLASRALLDAVERPTDLLRADGRIVAGSVYTGIDADANQLAERVRLLRGRSAYVAACVRALLRWRPVDYQVELDGVPHEVRGFTVIAANSPYLGGGLKVAPDADVADGRMDVVMIRHASLLPALGILGGVVLGGTHANRSEVTVVRGRTLTVRADGERPAYGDGEPVTHLPVTVEILPGALRLLVPPR